MNSAPAVLRVPTIAIESMSPPTELEDDPYPWAISTPEVSPRYWGSTSDVPVQSVPSLDFLRMVCEPCFEQICCIAQQMGVHATVSHEELRSMCDPCFEQVIDSLQQTCMTSTEMLRAMCNPFFEQMIGALQQTLQQNALQQHFNNQQFNNECQSMQNMPYSPNGFWFQPVYYPSKQMSNFDEASTEADDSLAGGDAIVSKSDDSESTSDAERSIMVCRHWKTKGWCRLESKCKFLHPEEKCGISAHSLHAACTAAGSSLVDVSSGELAEMTASAARRKKRKEKNRFTRRQEDDHANA